MINSNQTGKYQEMCLNQRPESLCSKARAHKTDQQQIYTPKPDGWQKAWHTTPHLSQPKTDCSHTDSQNEKAKTVDSNLAQDLWRIEQARFWGKRSHLNMSDSYKVRKTCLKSLQHQLRGTQQTHGGFKKWCLLQSMSHASEPGWTTGTQILVLTSMCMRVSSVKERAHVTKR